MPEQIRESFEKWFSENGAHPNAIKRSAGGTYLLSQASTSWEAWQAASASKDEEVQLLRTALADCVEWDAIMGRWDNPVWDRARAALGKTREGA